MLLKFQNKLLMALDKMISDGIELGGIPECIEITPMEALRFLEEFELIKKPLKISATDNTIIPTSIKMLINTHEKKKEFVNGWHKGKYSI